MKTKFLALFALTFLLADKCEDDEPAREHPGCPGESIVGAETGACVCGKGKVLRAGSLECADCDPVPSNGLYCDCGRNSVFSLDARIDSTVGLRSPQVECVEEAECEQGFFPDSNGTCKPCAANQCGVCGSCSVGDTCISGFCANVIACRVQDVYPDAVTYPYQNPKRDRCEFREGDLCTFGTFANAAVGDPCECFDSVDCYYEGRAEALSQ